MRKDFEAYIEGCIQSCIEQGWTIDKGSFINRTYKKCCPLGAVGIVYNFDVDDDTYLENIQHVLDIDGDLLNIFWTGFDDYTLPPILKRRDIPSPTEDAKTVIEVATKLNRKYLKTNGTQ